MERHAVLAVRASHQPEMPAGVVRTGLGTADERRLNGQSIPADPRPEVWAADLFGSAAASMDAGAGVLGAPSRGRAVCNCFGVHNARPGHAMGPAACL